MGMPNASKDAYEYPYQQTVAVAKKDPWQDRIIDASVKVLESRVGGVALGIALAVAGFVAWRKFVR